MPDHRYHGERTIGANQHPRYVSTVGRGRWAWLAFTAAGALSMLATTGCVAARAEYDPATGKLALEYRRLGDIEIEAAATRDAATGEPVVSIRSVSQAAALNTAVAALARMVEKAPTP